MAEYEVLLLQSPSVANRRHIPSQVLFLDCVLPKHELFVRLATILMRKALNNKIGHCSSKAAIVGLGKPQGEMKLKNAERRHDTQKDAAWYTA